MKLSGTMEVTEEVPGDLNLVVESNKCDLEMKSCVKYNTFNIGGVCQKFLDKKEFYSDVLSSITPPLKCPIKVGNYTLDERTLDLRIISFLPLDGYIWVNSYKLVSSQKGKPKKVILCLNAEIKIMRTNKRTKE